MVQDHRHRLKRSKSHSAWSGIPLMTGGLLTKRVPVLRKPGREAASPQLSIAEALRDPALTLPSARAWGLLKVTQTHPGSSLCFQQQMKLLQAQHGEPVGQSGLQLHPLISPRPLGDAGGTLS